jgi:hypothetical protein
MPKKITIAKQFEKIRSEVIAASFKQNDNDLKNPINWFSSVEAYEKERNGRSAELLKIYDGKIEDLVDRLSAAEMMLDLHKVVMPIQNKILEINAKFLNFIVEGTVAAGIKRNLPNKVLKDNYLELLRKAVKESKIKNISRKDFFELAKEKKIPRSPEAIQVYWSTLKREGFIT